MPSILDHRAGNSTKLMLIGDSGTGKTGAMASLVTAGYKIRYLDFDGGIEILVDYLTNPASPYVTEIKSKNIDLKSAVRYLTLTEKMKTLKTGHVMPASATVWERGMSALDEWKDEDGSLGKPRDWGKDTILIIDSLTSLSQAALYSIQSMNGRLGETKVGYDSQRDIGQAQTIIERFLQLIYDEGFGPHVILISHVTYRNPEGSAPDNRERQEFSPKRGYPSSIGVALAPRIPRYFNTVLQAEVEGSGMAAKHKIYTVPQGMINLKTSAPLRLKGSYDIGTGMAEIFLGLRGGGPGI